MKRMLDHDLGLRLLTAGASTGPPRDEPPLAGASRVTEDDLLAVLFGSAPADVRARVDHQVAHDARLRAQFEELRAEYDDFNRSDDVVPSLPVDLLLAGRMIEATPGDPRAVHDGDVAPFAFPPPGARVQVLEDGTDLFAQTFGGAWVVQVKRASIDPSDRLEGNLAGSWVWHEWLGAVAREGTLAVHLGGRVRLYLVLPAVAECGPAPARSGATHRGERAAHSSRVSSLNQRGRGRRVAAEGLLEGFVAKANGDTGTERTAKRGRKGNGSGSGKKGANGSAAVLGFEEKLWLAADKLRGSMDPAEYKHVVLGLIFLKYISDAFEQHHDKLAKDPAADPEDRDEYTAANVFWVPKSARWSALQAAAKSPQIGVKIDAAMDAIEAENATLRGTLPKDYARPALDKQRLGELIDLMSSVGLAEGEHRTKDVLGRVYEYFLAKFASAEGRLGGDFYTPQSVVRVLVEMLEPYRGRVYDPCCGSGGMFVQSEKFVEAHGGGPADLSVFGQEWNATTWRLCRMNLAIRGIEANLGGEWADSFRKDLHKGLKADFVLANPPFNVSDWGGEHLRDDARWVYGAPPVGNANFAWLQHIAHHLAPNGVAGVVLANGSMSSQQSGEGEIRRKMVEADLVDCMVALPGQLFYATQIPVCLWFLARSKSDKRFRARSGEVLFIDARKLGALVDRTHRELSEEDVARIARTYHAWRGEKDAGEYADVAGFCKSATRAEIEGHGFVLTPGRYVGAEAAEQDDEPFDAKMRRLTAELEKQFEEGRRLEEEIRKNLRSIGYAT